MSLRKSVVHLMTRDQLEHVVQYLVTQLEGKYVDTGYWISATEFDDVVSAAINAEVEQS